MKTTALKIIALSEFVLIASMAALLVPGWTGMKIALAAPEGRPGMIKGIAIHYLYDRAEFFPSAWLEAPVDCGGGQVDLSEAERVVPLIEVFAAAYDPSFIQKNLTDIYLLGDLHCYEHPYGGTNGISSIYLRVGTRADGYTDRVLLATLHEEFSSILFRNYDFPKETWKSLEGNGYEYPNDSIEILDQPGLKADASDEMLERGLLTRYAASSLENDFNEYAGWMFVWPDRLCDYGSLYEAVERKATLVNAFYRSIEPNMETWSCEWDPRPRW
jgi:putative zinc-binding metallo-peptidase